MSDDRKIGLMFCREGNNTLVVRTVARNEGKYQPTGLPWWYAGDKTPYLTDLLMRGRSYEFQGRAVFYTDRIVFKSEFGIEIDAAKAKAMADVLAKVEKQLTKDAAWDDDGDKLLALARAIGAKFICVPYTSDRKITESWDRTQWTWHGLADGRNAYRNTIDVMKLEVMEAHKAEVLAKAA